MARPNTQCTVTLQHVEGFQPTGKTSTVRAKYVAGCDGARSVVRTSIGRQLAGDPMNQSWGVMDVLAVTDFPDIRLKSVIHSANQGNLLIIPREGGYRTWFYIELDQVHDQEMLRNRSVSPEKLAEVANRILHPYTVEVKDVGLAGVGLRNGQRELLTSSMTCRRSRMRYRPRGCPGSSSPATPATRTAPKPVRA